MVIMIHYTYDELWKVRYATLITVRIGKGVPYLEMYNWLRENCKEKFYILPTWAGNGAQFEDDEDAVLFALRWTNETQVAP